MRKLRLGLFGGSFDPIHIGHLVLAQTAWQQLKLDRVLFIPARRPPHKQQKVLLPEHQRVKLIELAIEDNPAFELCKVEIERPGPSYTIDTVNELRQIYPKCRFFLIIGQDMLSIRWKHWDVIERACSIVAAQRHSAAASSQGTGFNNRIQWLRVPRLEIASSTLRDRIRSGHSIRYLVPSTVENYIQKHKLYRSSSVRRQHSDKP